MKNSGMQNLIEKRMSQIENRQKQLAENWAPYLDAVDEYLQEKHDTSMDPMQRQMVSQCLENTLDEHGLRRNKLFEATTESDISFLGVQLPVIAALLPTLVLNKIAMVQALDRRSASVFFFNAKYGDNKGSISDGDSMINARTGHNRSTAGRRYAMAYVEDEAMEADGGGTLGMSNGVTLGTIQVKDEAAGTILGQDYGEAYESGGSNTAGTVRDTSGNTLLTVSSAGVYDSATYNANWPSGSAVDAVISYQYKYDVPVDAYNDRSGVPEVDFAVTQENISAMDFPVRSKYSIGASIDLMKAHGINLESEVVKFLGGEVKFTIDHYGIDLISDAAENGTEAENGDGSYSTLSPASAIGSLDLNLSSGEPWIWKKWEISDYFEKGSNNIFAATLRGVASYIVAGNNVARVIKQLTGSFKPKAQPKPPTGPMEIGTLDGRTVIQDPFLSSNRYIMGYKGDNFLYSSFAYCPYIPLFASPTLVTSDLYAQKGFLSSAGFKVINPALLTYGTISGTAF